MNLERIQWIIKKFLYNINEIYDDNNFVNIYQISGLVETTSDSK